VRSAPAARRSRDFPEEVFGYDSSAGSVKPPCATLSFRGEITAVGSSALESAVIEIGRMKSPLAKARCGLAPVAVDKPALSPSAMDRIQRNGLPSRTRRS
jgi:hypothetical protein